MGVLVSLQIYSDNPGHLISSFFRPRHPTQSYFSVLMDISFRQHDNISVIEETIKEFVFFDGDGFDALRTDSDYIFFEDASLVIHNHTAWYDNNKVQFVINIFTYDREEDNEIKKQECDKHIPETWRTKPAIGKNQ